MKKMVCAFAMVLVLLSIGSGGALAAGVEGNINMLIGQKYLEEDDWEPVDTQAALGLMFDITPAGSPVAIALDIFATEDSADLYDAYFDEFYEATGKTQEIDLGFRWYTPPNMFRGYVGGGLAFVNAEIEVEQYGYRASEEDDAIGFFINGGFTFTLARHLNLGLNVRYSQADVEIAGYDIEAGGVTLAGVVGYHF